MLADADLPEADDEFSYREDPRDALLAHLFRDGVPGSARLAAAQERYRHPLIPSGYNETRLAELVGKAKAASDEAARLLVEYQARHPLMPVTGMYAGVSTPAFLRNPVIPLPRTFDVAAENARIFAIQHPRTYSDAIGADGGTEEQLLHRLKDVSTTFGVDLDEPSVTSDPVDHVNHPSHYVDVVPGVECIDVTEHFSFLRGNAIKYLWRAGSKGDTLEDLRKSVWYIEREIKGLS